MSIRWKNSICFFSNVGNILQPDGTVSDLEFNRSLNWNGRNPNSFFLKPVDNEEIFDVISKLKLVKSHIDSLPVKLFINLKHLLAQPLIK